MKLYLVTRKQRDLKTGEPNWQHLVVNIYSGTGDEREYVKREAQRYLLGDPDHYTVNPLTNHGDVVFVSLSMGEASK